MQQIAIVVDIFPGFWCFRNQTFGRSPFRPAHQGLDASPPTRHDRAVWLSTLDRGLDSSIYTHGRRQSTTARHQTSTTSAFERLPVHARTLEQALTARPFELQLVERPTLHECTLDQALTARPFELQQVARPTVHATHARTSIDCSPIRATTGLPLHLLERKTVHATPDSARTHARSNKH